ncbi:MAG: CesT family type III secretion system chaperone [Methylocystis sp.]|uniref:CesT family type III secretion system chaperone n=1 Tax=Methylocystis sp. TaxID=1911079 RepID=UPI003DA482D3
MTREEAGQLLAATAHVGNWLELTDFESGGLFILVMSEDMSASLSFNPETELLRATFDVATLPDDSADARREIMETLLNANAFAHDGDGVAFGLSPHDETVTLSANLPAIRGGERDLAGSLSGLAALVEAWRPLIRSIESRTTPADAPEPDPQALLTFRP